MRAVSSLLNILRYLTGRGALLLHRGGNPRAYFVDAVNNPGNLIHRADGFLCSGLYGIYLLADALRGLRRLVG